MTTETVHGMLCEVLNELFPDGEDRCYFEPPSNLQMNYPCIVYNYVGDSDKYADNVRYHKFKRYSVTSIDYDPDSKITEKLKDLKYCSFDRVYTTNGLKHFVHVLYSNKPRITEE